MQNCSTTMRGPSSRSPLDLIFDGGRQIGMGVSLATVILFDSVLSAMDAATARRHLHALDDRMLQDIGLSRSQIDYKTKR